MLLESISRPNELICTLLLPNTTPGPVSLRAVPTIVPPFFPAAKARAVPSLPHSPLSKSRAILVPFPLHPPLGITYRPLEPLLEVTERAYISPDLIHRAREPKFVLVITLLVDLDLIGIIETNLPFLPA